MSDDTTRLDALADDWLMHARELAGAVVERDYRRLQQHVRRGADCVQAIEHLLAHGRPTADTHRKLTEAAHAWQLLPDEINRWRDEIGDRLRTVRKHNDVARKLKRGYNQQPPAAGTHVILNAD